MAAHFRLAFPEGFAERKCAPKFLKIISCSFFEHVNKYTHTMGPVAMRHALRAHCPTRLPRGTVVWGLGCGWTVAHGRRVSPKPRIPMVLRSFLRECCVGLWGGGGGGHGPQYQTRRVARAPCALCACARPLQLAFHVNPLSKNPLAVVLP